MDNEHTAFSTSSEDAISRVIDVKVDNTTNQFSDEQFDTFYEIQWTAHEIVKGSYKRVALQFPDELLHDSVPVYRKLKSRITTECDLYVLADTSYGSCCVDEVAAQHIEADAMVHYGHACMSQTSRLPVLYVFGKKDIEVDLCVKRLTEEIRARVMSQEMNPKAVLLRHDVVFTHQTGKLAQALSRMLEPIGVTLLYNPPLTKTNPDTGQQLEEKTSSDLTSAAFSAIVYIGGESLALTNLLMMNASCDVYSYNPDANIVRLESARTNRLLMRRYVAVQKARDADVFGILVGTLGVASYLPLIRHIRTLLSKKRKKSYTISVGKLNPAKLANFLEIECFVLVACPENSLIEAKDFLRPIVTPYELQVALQPEPTWPGRYELDFSTLLKAQAHEGASDERDSEDSDQPMFSLVTGKYRHPKQYGGVELHHPEGSADSSAVVLRNQDTALAKLDDSAGAQFLMNRSYQGLETRIGEDAPSLLEQGRSGIARGYQDDHKTHQ